MLIEDPETLHDLAGVDLPQAEALRHGRAVFCGLVGLASKLGLVVELDLILGAAGLQARGEGEGRRQRWREGEEGWVGNRRVSTIL